MMLVDSRIYLLIKLWLVDNICTDTPRFLHRSRIIGGPEILSQKLNIKKKYTYNQI